MAVELEGSERKGRGKERPTRVDRHRSGEVIQRVWPQRVQLYVPIFVNKEEKVGVVENVHGMTRRLGRPCRGTVNSPDDDAGGASDEEAGGASDEGSASGEVVGSGSADADGS